MKHCGVLVAALAIVAGGYLALGSSTAAARDYDCADFSSQAEAQEYLLPGDPYNLDGDSDGVACEDNPCPCSSSAGPAESYGGGHSEPTKLPPPPPPYKLKMHAARRAALAVVAEFVRRSPIADGANLGPCVRRSPRRIDCTGVARGATEATRSSCDLRVAVPARNRRPRARLAGVRCTTTRTRFLTAARARGAIRERGSELAGKEVGVFELARLDASAFRGIVEWTERSDARPPATEKCTARIEAALTSGEAVATQVLESGCEPVVLF
jgi:hypothetical protein